MADGFGSVNQIHGGGNLPGTAETTTRSTKCGVATTLLTAPVVSKLDAEGGLAFWTGWNANPALTLDPSSTRMQFVSWAASTNGIDFLTNGPQAGSYISTMLLGVNEPDGTIGGGSKPTTPEEYAQLWPTIVDTARGKGYTDFAGPQLASSDPNNLGVGLDWQVRFMTALDQELVGKEKSSYLTYVSYHIYEPNCKNDASDIANFYQGQMATWKERLAQWWTEYNIQGFVLSEYAGAPWSDACDATGQMNMVRNVLPQVLSMPDVKHLSWFSDSSAGGDKHGQAHYLWKGDSLTDLGEEYLKVCNRVGISHDNVTE